MDQVSPHEQAWQGYDNLSQPTKAVSQAEAALGVLHGSSHIWIWRKRGDGSVEVLLQLRSQTKRTWPGFYDISAAGHIDFGETPLVAALRETKEEIGLDLIELELKLLFVHRAYMVTEGQKPSIENEFRWDYGYELPQIVDFELQSDEVAAMKWVSLDDCKALARNEDVMDIPIVPQGIAYFTSLFSEIDRLTAESITPTTVR